MEYSNAFVCLMGIATVFFGLICIIFLSGVMSRLCANPPVKASAPAAAPIANRPQLIAAIAAGIAEELGTDISAIRILSIKKV